MIAPKMWLAGLAAVFVLWSGGNAQAKDRKDQYRELVSGSAAPSSFDFNGDGVKGHYVTFAGRSSLGPVHGGILVEYDFAGGLVPDPACPAGTLKLAILASAGNRALTGTEEMILMEDDAASALFCLNPATGDFTMLLKGKITGGLGRFAGATGTYSYKGSGKVQLQDSTGMPFGGFILETQGIVVLPNRRNHD
jgi:hypothetical protein